MQKPLIKFAWGVQAFQQQLARVHGVCVRIGGFETDKHNKALLGGTAILLRQIFAAKGQKLLTVDMTWPRRSVQARPTSAAFAARWS